MKDRYFINKFVMVGFLAMAIMPSQGQPTGLTTDLIEHTDQTFFGGKYALVLSSNPTFGWIVPNHKKGTLQSAYRVQVATSERLLNEGKPDMWDSQKVLSSNSVSVIYEGASLQSNSCYFWRVKTWDNHGKESAYSAIRRFETGNLEQGGISHYPLTKTEELPVVHIRNENSDFFDFGKDAFGQLVIEATCSADSDTLTIQLGERSNGTHVDGNIKGLTIRYAKYQIPIQKGTHTYNLVYKKNRRNTKTRGESLPILMPDDIGEVLPFRYCEVSSRAAQVSLVRYMVHYPFNDQAATFTSSDSVLNQVWELCKYSMKATSFAGIYVDGDRERIPYEADALINQMGHYCTDREFTMARRSVDHLLKNATWPTEWLLQSVILAWNDYLATGDKRLLADNYDLLHEKTLYRLREANGLISTKTGKVTDETKQAVNFRGISIKDIVDWPLTGAAGIEKENEGEADGYVFTDYNTVVNSYHYYALTLMAKISTALNKHLEARSYKEEADRVKTQINTLLFDKAKGIYFDGTDTDHHSLHANMFPLAFGIVPEVYQKSVCDFIRSRGMACSVYGAQFLLDAVYEGEMADYGLSLLASTGLRSWYNMIREGSTISMEAWGNTFKDNQDWNHAWGAAPANLIPRDMVGIQPLEPGFRRVRIKPQPASLESFTMSLPTIRGTIVVDYKKGQLCVEIPANMEAELWLPWNGKRKVVGSGKYQFQ